MKFCEAYEALKQGSDIKRPSWKGFWRKENGTIVMYCKDGSKVPFMETECIFVDIDHMMADDWEIVNGDTVTGLNITTFTFGEAISRLKRRERVARKGWNGKNQHIELASNISYISSDGEVVNCEHEAIGNKAIAFIGTGVQMGWLASQADMLADDWVVVM
nr:DUF2829 domain-containing protein [uncultured Clostridium sp.]